MAQCSTKELEALCKSICEISDRYGCSAEEAGEALRAMNYRLSSQTVATNDLANYCYNEINDLQSARADASARIVALESKEPFRIFEEDFELDGVPMKVIASPDYPDCLYLIPENKEKPIKIVYESDKSWEEDINDWYKDFLERLDKSLD